MSVNVTINNEQKVKITLAPVTGSGKPATLDGKPTWTKTSPADPNGATLEVSEDGLSCTLISSDAPGDTVVLVEADADLGEGIETVSEIIQLKVEGARAASLGLVIGSAEPK